MTLQYAPHTHRPAPASRLLHIALLIILVSAPAQTLAQDQEADEAAVRAAAFDYVEALYQADPDRIARSVHTDLAKTGVMNRPGAPSTRFMPMSYDQLHQLAAGWNSDNRQGITPETLRKVEILDLLDNTASVKLTAQWGIDYMHMAKVDGTWKIMNVLWQPHPQAR